MARDPKKRLQKVFKTPSRAKQQFKDECDVNNIVSRHKATGLVTHVNRATPKYGDYSDAGSFQEAMEIVLSAQEQFMALPAPLRARFGNDPAQFLEFVGNEENREEAIKLDLIEKKADPVKPDPTEVIVIEKKKDLPAEPAG